MSTYEKLERSAYTQGFSPERVPFIIGHKLAREIIMEHGLEAGAPLVREALENLPEHLTAGASKGALAVLKSLKETERANAIRRQFKL